MKKRISILNKNSSNYLIQELQQKNMETDKWEKKHIRNLGKPVILKNGRIAYYKNSYLWIKSTMIRDEGIRKFLGDEDQYLLDYMLKKYGIVHDNRIENIKNYILYSKPFAGKIKPRSIRGKEYSYYVSFSFNNSIKIYLLYDKRKGFEITFDTISNSEMKELYVYQLPVSDEVLTSNSLISSPVELLLIKEKGLKNPIISNSSKDKMNWNRFKISDTKSLLYRSENITYTEFEKIAVIWLMINSALENSDGHINIFLNRDILSQHISLIETLINISLSVYDLLLDNVSISAKKRLLGEESLFKELLKVAVFKKIQGYKIE